MGSGSERTKTGNASYNWLIDTLTQNKNMYAKNLPGSGSPKPGGGCAESGPGVLPEPGDLTSSFIAPPYESEELGGLWKCSQRKD